MTEPIWELSHGTTLGARLELWLAAAIGRCVLGSKRLGVMGVGGLLRLLRSIVSCCDITDRNVKGIEMGASLSSQVGDRKSGRTAPVMSQAQWGVWEESRGNCHHPRFYTTEALHRPHMYSCGRSNRSLCPRMKLSFNRALITIEA